MQKLPERLGDDIRDHIFSAIFETNENVDIDKAYEALALGLVHITQSTEELERWYDELKDIRQVMAQCNLVLDTFSQDR
jgi:hypothetical protein